MFVDALVHVFICGFTSCSVFLTSFIYGLCIIRSYLFVGHHPYLFTVHTRTDTHRHAHTLAQNCHCEFCCRVHLTCKNNPFKPDRRRSLRGPEKQWKAAIAIASANWRKLEADPFQQSHIAPNLTDCENRARSAKSKIKLFENGMVGLGLATSHHRILT